MDLGIKGRTALVTGGSQGIGKAIAAHLAAEGVQVVICARRPELLNETAAEIQRRTGSSVLPLQADIGKPEEVHAMIEKLMHDLGRLDILVNNAASFQDGPFLTLPDEEWLNHFHVKLLGCVRCVREVIPQMKRNQWGRIVNIAGIAARMSGNSGYLAGAVNAALVNMTKKLSDELASFNITVNAVHPGMVRTGRREADYAKAMKERGIDVERAKREIAGRIPLGRLIEPAEVADAVVFMASERASALTGQAIAVDGGAVRGVYY